MIKNCNKKLGYIFFLVAACIALGDDGKAGVNADSCIDCGACVGDCPVSAINL